MKAKRILIGVTGGIAAYKIASLIRLFKKEEAEVKVIMTPASCDFISPLTLSTLSENPVYIDFWNKSNGEWVNHVDLGLWADVMIIAPCTANTLAKLAHGFCDNLLCATYLSAKCDVVICPAMDLDMYAHFSTNENIKILKENGVEIIPANTGQLASGLVGKGRLPEPEEILNYIKEKFNLHNLFQGNKVLITAGPTLEKIDPVRYISNFSSGKMGFAIAERFLEAGAEVILITGPTNLSIVHPNLTVVSIKSADDLLDEVKKYWEKVDVGIFAAAVADYKVKSISEQKIKKNDESLTIELIKNPDILAWAGQNKKNQFLVGFALETNDGEHYAFEKLKKKNADAIVLNKLESNGVGFQFDTNKISILDKNNNITNFELKLKKDVAKDILLYIKSNC